jgi:hypothetical protein
MFAAAVAAGVAAVASVAPSLGAGAGFEHAVTLAKAAKIISFFIVAILVRSSGRSPC